MPGNDVIHDLTRVCVYCKHVTISPSVFLGFENEVCEYF